MKGALLKSIQASGVTLAVAPHLAMKLLLHSIGAGLLLMVVTLAANLAIRKRKRPEEVPDASARELVLSCSNVLFLCFAMCGVIILVNNDLARAFALGAAIALVRFRIKLNAKTLGSAMLYGIVTGMACGVGQIFLAWGIAAAYCVMQLALLGALHFIPDEKEKKSSLAPMPSLSRPLTPAHGLE